MRMQLALIRACNAVHAALSSPRPRSTSTRRMPPSRAQGQPTSWRRMRSSFLLSAVVFLAVALCVSGIEPLYEDPRSDPTCASFLGNATAWRRRSHSLEAMAIEDVRYGRSAPEPRARFERHRENTVCFGRGDGGGETAVVRFHSIPKCGSTATIRKLRTWPGGTACCRQHSVAVDRDGTRRCAASAAVLRPLAFTFTRHPFSRLVSAFQTVLAGWYERGARSRTLADAAFVGAAQGCTRITFEGSTSRVATRVSHALYEL